MRSYSEPNPPARLVEAVAKGDVDVAVLWGPFAGYFGRRQPVPLDITAVSPEQEPNLPFVFDIAVGVNKEQKALRAEIDAILVRRRRMSARSSRSSRSTPDRAITVASLSRPCPSRPEQL